MMRMNGDVCSTIKMQIPRTMNYNDARFVV